MNTTVSRGRCTVEWSVRCSKWYSLAGRCAPNPSRGTMLITARTILRLAASTAALLVLVAGCSYSTGGQNQPGSDASEPSTDASTTATQARESESPIPDASTIPTLGKSRERPQVTVDGTLYSFGGADPALDRAECSLMDDMTRVNWSSRGPGDDEYIVGAILYRGDGITGYLPDSLSGSLFPIMSSLPTTTSQESIWEKRL